jgi:hypothetical protein
LGEPGCILREDWTVSAIRDNPQGRTAHSTIHIDNGKAKKKHRFEEHDYRRRPDMIQWHGWHAFRRGLASNLNQLHVSDLTIQRILRHSNLATTRKSCIKIRQDNVTAGMAQMEAEIRRTETLQTGSEIQKAERPN